VDRELLAVLLQHPDRQREVIALRLFLDLDTEQTARTLGIAPGTVRVHLTDLDEAGGNVAAPIAHWSWRAPPGTLHDGAGTAWLNGSQAAVK
jgi:predicted ArsR family transcriptional regulator